MTSDVWDGVVHGVVKQQRGQPRQGNNDSGRNWQLFFLHPHPNLCTHEGCIQPPPLRISSHETPLATMN